MDPKANLDEQRHLAAEIIALQDSNEADGGNAPEVYRAAVRLAELVQALDEWRRKEAQPEPREVSMVCPGCRRFDRCIFGANPYAADMNNDHTPVWLCAECRYQAVQDI